MTAPVEREIPNGSIRGPRETEVGDVVSPTTLSRKPTGQRNRQLGVDEEPHQATCKTGWSL